jgi:hypothetical protein
LIVRIIALGRTNRENEMSLLGKMGIFAAALASAASMATAASAADDSFCRDYARETVQQVNSAFQARRCGWDVRQNPARWNPDWRSQMDWCRHTSRKNVDRERNARTGTLAHCLQPGGWGPGRGPDDR